MSLVRIPDGAIDAEEDLMTVSRLVSVVGVLGTIIVLAGPLRADALDETLGKVVSALDSHVANLTTFSGNTDRIFSRFSSGQRAEIERRVTYVLDESRMTRAALDGVIRARREVLEAGSSAVSAGRRHEAVMRAVEAFEDYRALFDAEVSRCFIDSPEPVYLRLIERLASVPVYRYGERAALKREIEASFMEYADAYVEATSQALQPRRDTFFHALKNLQYSGSGFDLGLQYRFDRAFFAYQALYTTKSEPAYGVPVARDFPVASVLEPLVVFKPTSYASQYSKGVKTEEIERLLPEAYSDIRSLPEDALSREARRIKELHELVATYERAAQRGDQTALDQAWLGYQELRDRWDKVD